MDIVITSAGITAVITVLAKMTIMAFVSVIIAAITLWPANEQPVSKTQIGIFIVLEILAALLIFGAVTFSIGK